MTDTNPTRSRFAENKDAFQQILGDPFALEPIEGHYNLLKRRSPNRTIESTAGEGRATVNAAQPSSCDFFCDVEKVIGMVITDTKQLTRFINTYILGDIDNILTQAERNRLEQRIGKLLRIRRIAPVGEYFTAIRRPLKRENT